ncbi:MAG: biotin attachment protein [Candidatus Brocadiaceae bacterium]|nr:biotin attachment protein [Candidatus Brocadiaceae bacterium]
MVKKVRFMDTSFRDGFQSVYGARVLTQDFMPAVEATVEAGITHMEAGGGARFQSLFFYCNESAFHMMDTFRKFAGPDADLQTLARGINVVALSQAPKDIINLHAVMFKKHGMTTIRNFDALNDIQNLEYSGKCITDAGLHHQVCITLMDLPEACEEAHTAEFYLHRLKAILDSGLPFGSVCFKDASGTANPQKVYETFKGAREMLGEDALIWFHTHDTAGVSVACCLAAIEGGATKDNNLGIDLAKSPVCGGTCQPDIISMWHALKGKDWTLDIDIMKVIEAEKIFEECMKDYFVPLEAKQVSPIIPLSPMPGGALTANTMMMRDTGTLDLYPQVIREMTEVVKKGGYATSVTPVSQFYFQQAYANVTQGKWKKITDGYGNMVLGYFGRTPSKPDPEIVKLAEKQLGKKPFDGHPLDILEPGIPQATKTLEEHKLEVTDENIFIAFACGEKGIEFLQGKTKENIRKVSAETEAKATAPAQTTGTKGPGNYTVTVDGKPFNVTVAEGTNAVQTISQAPTSPAIAIKGEPVVASMPGSVTHIEVGVGDTVKEGDVILVLEAMKMESPIKAPKDSRIISIEVAVGDNVKNGDTLAMIE